ncbi:MAG: hypothetical protein ABSE76_01180 [Minisyncoccia bacterium]|jgi:hypothetical protein
MTLLKRIIPVRYHYRLVQIKNIFTGYRQTHYSQFGEDIVLQKLFANQAVGRYVDVGAHLFLWPSLFINYLMQKLW